MSRWRNPLLLLLVLVCAGSLYWSRRPDQPPATGPQRADPVPAAPATVAETVHLAVLNGTGESGLARRLSRQLAARGCVVVRLDNAPHESFARTLLINRRLTRAAARRLADRLGGPPLLQEWDPRVREDAVLVLGRDHARFVTSLDEAP